MKQWQCYLIKRTATLLHSSYFKKCKFWPRWKHCAKLVKKKKLAKKPTISEFCFVSLLFGTCWKSETNQHFTSPRGRRQLANFTGIRHLFKIIDGYSSIRKCCRIWTYMLYVWTYITHHIAEYLYCSTF